MKLLEERGLVTRIALTAANEMGRWLYAPPQQRLSDDSPLSEHAAPSAQDISLAGGAV